MVSGDQMRHFVSSQTYALRHFAASRPGPDRFGFAWAPNNATELPASDFTLQTGQLLDRLGAALSEPVDACLQSCHTDVDGAAFTNAWRIFSSWEQQVLRGLRRPLVPRVRTVVLRTKGRR
jgi:hypothetical protein